MSLLTPQLSAYAAENVYKIKTSQEVESQFHSTLLERFSLTSESRFNGTSGALFFKHRSGFGVIARGKGEFQGDALLTMRGTSDGADLLTDLNIGFSISPAGQLVHQGFNHTFRSFFGQHVRPFLQRHSFNQVHCVGHSLGGALATLSAERIAAEGLGRPVLYTFGSPRVGSDSFAQKLTASLGADRIFRACHRTDVVSLVPLWPFTHAPRPGIECHINNPGLVPGVSYHFMRKYVDSVSGKTAWDALRVPAPVQDFDVLVKEWLGKRETAGFTMSDLRMVSHAIGYLAKKVSYATGISIQAVGSAGLTAFDVLARSLAQGAAASKEILDEVKGLVRHMLSMLGKAVSAVVEVTADVIRSTFLALLRQVYRLANDAIRIVHQA